MGSAPFVDGRARRRRHTRWARLPANKRSRPLYTSRRSVDRREQRMTRDVALDLARRNQSAHVTQLADLVAIPSVSVDRQQRRAMEQCARRLASMMRQAGLPRVELVRCGGPPVVYGRSPHRPARPRLLIYGHYDVQPADEQGWTLPAFRPELRAGRLFGRGVSDNKGPVVAHLAALRAVGRAFGTLPLNVICVFDGEEEIGSPHLLAFLRDRAAELDIDVAVVSDTRMLSATRPAMVYALRGSLTLDLDVRGPARNLHVGAFGGAVRNPLHTLADIISSLHDQLGSSAVCDLDSEIRRVSANERTNLAESGPTDALLERDAGVPLWGTPGFTAYERTTLLPSVNVTAVSTSSGHDLTAIPARASARINVRLVPDQNPHAVVAAIRRHVAAAETPAAHISLRLLTSSCAVRTITSGPYVVAAVHAYEIGFGREPVFVRSGGTIPAVSMIQNELGAPILLMGFTPPDSRMHGPDEQLDLAVLGRAIDTCIAFLTELAAFSS
jgi:acetylornithine deacetylase/succinyl-diaminopimelate desuccinylase-like protein